MTRLKTDHIYRIDLNRGTLEADLPQPLMHQDAQADVFTAALRRGMTPIDLTGATVRGFMTFASSGETLLLEGTASGNTAAVLLTEDCYAHPGRFALAIQVLLDETRHTVLRVQGSIARTASQRIAAPDGSIPTLDALLAELDGLSEAKETIIAQADRAEAAALQASQAADNAVADSLAQIDEAIQRANEAAGAGALPTIYCWGDSLTEGVGGWLTTPDGAMNAIVSAYPDVVAQTYPCMNLGVRTETVQEIMARQGADPIVVGGFTIPASAEESVAIGYSRGAWWDADALGLTTVSGELVQPLRESEAGLNPCTIAGIKGEIFRSMEKDSENRFTYSFQRLEDGAETPVPAGTEVQTQGMTFYRGGAAVIWMGANGHTDSVAEYIACLHKMIDYGQYKNYLILIAREYDAATVQQIEAAFTDADGTCHVLYLLPPLLRRGYTLAGVAVAAGWPDTSGWTSTTDELKRQRPLLMASTGSGEANFETLHFSAYGYKAIGKLVVEKLNALLAKSAAPEDPDTPDTPDNPDAPLTDEFGTLAYRLAEPAVFDGTTAAIDTGWAPYDDPTKDWTVAIKYSDDIDHLTNQYNTTLCHMQEGVGMDATANLWLFSNRAYFPACDLNFIVATANYEYHQQGHGNTVSADGWHYAIVSKSGANVSYYIDGYHIATQERTFDVTSAKTLFIGGASGETGLTGTIAQVRIYDAGLTAEQCSALYPAMQ